MLGGIFHIYSNFNRTICKQTEETLTTPQNLVLTVVLQYRHHIKRRCLVKGRWLPKCSKINNCKIPLVTNFVQTCSLYQFFLPGRVAQSVTCLATDACMTADPGVASSIPARYHTFVEIDHEIISTVILLPSADLFKKSVTSESMFTNYWLTACSSLPRKKVWLSELTVPQ